MERLQKEMAKRGIASRRQSEELIKAGKVKVNGKLVVELGTKVEANDIIEVSGKKITDRQEYVYYVLHKPEGFITTTSDEHNRKTVMDLMPDEVRIFPVGRLDANTSGVLLFTNDGELTESVLKPNFHVEKEYHVKAQGLIRKAESKSLEQQMDLGDFTTGKARVLNVKYDDKKENSFVDIVITEGKNHQVKRMFEKIEHPVLKLKRTRFGNIVCDIPVGAYRRLKAHEVKTLWNLIKNGK